jgi:hypothetical protein
MLVLVLLPLLLLGRGHVVLPRWPHHSSSQARVAGPLPVPHTTLQVNN